MEQSGKFIGSNEEKSVFTNKLCAEDHLMPPPNSNPMIGGMTETTKNFMCISRSTKNDKSFAFRQKNEKVVGNGTQGDISELSLQPSNWGAHKVQKQADLSNDVSDNLTKHLTDVRMKFPDNGHSETHDMGTAISLSSNSRYIVGISQKTTSHQSRKRKSRDIEQSESKRRPLKSTSAQRSRAADVHNLSERRRRGRINGKLKALRELLPHCNKTDKASMLDEAIEYIKSLQLQLQMMLMGSGMVPMMFPYSQQFLSAVGGGTSQCSKIPLINQLVPLTAATTQTDNIYLPMLDPAFFQNIMWNATDLNAYAHTFGFNQMRPGVKVQGIDLLSTYETQSPQPHKATPLTDGSEPCEGGSTSAE